MCGRYTIRRPDLIRAGLRHQPTLGFEEFDEHIVPRFNIAPSQLAPIVHRTDKGYQLLMAKWGLIPFWAKEKPKLQPINAKCETVASSAMFRHAFQKRRCLVPADGFYEWQGSKPPRQAFFIHFKSEEPFAFAGLCDRWKPADGDPVDSFTILTTRPNELMEPIHNRMPLILQEKDYDLWLGEEKPTELLQPPAAEGMEAYPVSHYVNSPKHEGPECLQKA